MMTLADVNAMPLPEFLAGFGDVAEHSPWVAREAASFRPFTTRGAMIAAFETALRAANGQAQLALIRAHPDLATRAKLTTHSTNEQAGAGLDTLSTDEFAGFTARNDAYKAKFGFPFIFAVKGATKDMVLEAFTARLNNTPDVELATALTQICRIFRFRVEDRVAP